jgi:glutathione-regulated potassium-efflux system ancillary protein KefF
VLEDGWAYGLEGSAVRDKGYWLVATTGGDAAEFGPGQRHGRPFSDFLAPFEQTARLCGMHWIDPHILHGAHQVDAGAVDDHIAAFLARLERLAGGAPSLEFHADTAAAHGT